MLTVKQTIKNSRDLQKLLEKSKNRRELYRVKNLQHCERNKEHRKYALNQPYPIGRMEKGRKIFPILLFLMRCRLMLSGVKIIALNRLNQNRHIRPVIFVSTHIGKFDIEVVYSCIKEHALLLSGTEDRMHGSMNGFFLEKNGVNYVDRSDKEDRANAVNKMTRDLKNGFNLLWFPEGTWNLSANQLVYDISYSVIKLASECNVEIIPIGLNQIGKDVYIKFGEAYAVDTCKRVEELVIELRDMLATLKWDIYEYVERNCKDGYIERHQLTDDYWSNYIIDRVKEWPMTDLLEEMDYVYHPKDEAHVFYEEFMTEVLKKC